MPGGSGDHGATTGYNFGRQSEFMINYVYTYMLFFLDDSTNEFKKRNLYADGLGLW